MLHSRKDGRDGDEGTECWRIVYSYLMNEQKGKSVEEREFRLEWKQNPFRVKCFPVIGGNCGVDRRHLNDADAHPCLTEIMLHCQYYVTSRGGNPFDCAL